DTAMPRHAPGRSILLAVSMFSSIPLPARAHRSIEPLDRRVVAGAMSWLPIVGGVLAFLAGALGTLIAHRSHSAALGSTMAVAALAAATGALHWDGLSDTADGLASRKEPADAVEIMHRGDIGPVGVIAVVFTALGQVLALASIETSTTHWWRP